TGCSSGQGMMLACNSMPGVLCGYAPTPQDAFLFAQINNGNAVSLPLGEGYTWSGQENLEQTIARLFSEPFGQGYPKDERERKIGDANLLKRIREQSQVGFVDLLHTLDNELIQKNHDQEGRRRFCFCGRRRSRVEAMAPRAKEKNKVKIFYFVFFFAELDAWNPLARQDFRDLIGKTLMTK
ncbi:MAG: RpiB/LacA/LacB family sugar-phosphate isomerase, partial [Schwartzia sp.]|nr:RpiB/LacA/LacB family sugar-phosphate isomerase [Schwartzia sp. (in: firmicutes)]